MIKKFLSFFNKFFSFLKKKSIKDTPTLLIQNELSEDIIEQSDEKVAIIEEEEKVNVAKRTLMTKLYMLEQEIVFFEKDFPVEYQAFMERIEVLRDNYNYSLEEIKKILTFEIDPELNWEKIGEVIKLETDIKEFIEKEVKFSIISKRLQNLITKLNVLYNVSIFHTENCEKEKVMSQLKHALESATKLTREFKECDSILADNQLKERIVNLISYADYEIFKTSIRNSNITPEKLIKNLVMSVEFDKFDYIGAFIAFVKDEISDLGELLTLISNDECRRILENNSTNLLTELTYATNTEKQILDTSFWNSFLDFESSLLEMLKVSGVEKEKTKVKIIDRMNISIDENEVLVLPKTNAYLALTSLYAKTQDTKILLLIKLLRNLSDDITYKEIYFLLLLFDAIEVVQNTPNELVGQIEKYVKKYPYNRKTINDKKKSVMNSFNKEYVVIFTFNDYEKELVTTLEKLNIDFKIIDDKILINSFYLNGLENVLNCLQIYSKNIMI